VSVTCGYKVAEEATLIVTVSDEFVAERLSSATEPKQNLDGHSYEDDGSVETVATRRVITRDRALAIRNRKTRFTH
jgi:hypothetical protein